MISNLFLWNHSLRSQINLHHCSPGETVRGKRAKSVARCCLSVKIVRSCRDIGEMQWNRCHPCHHDIELVIVESFTAFTCCFSDTIILSLCLCTFAMFKHFHCNYVCAPLFATEVIHGIMVPSLFGMSNSGVVFQFRTERADASHWIVRCTFLGSDVNEWTRCVSLKRCDVCRWSCSGNIETWRFQVILL